SHFGLISTQLPAKKRLIIPTCTIYYRVPNLESLGTGRWTIKYANSFMGEIVLTIRKLLRRFFSY
ncbi:MAG: hypothetical protein Q8N20_05400, partial [Eubacteriales bacterium]|nr:hypothetical protein [Eubacteriales bacterium]